MSLAGFRWSLACYFCLELGLHYQDLDLLLSSKCDLSYFLWSCFLLFSSSSNLYVPLFFLVLVLCHASLTLFFYLFKP